ncbi:DUF4255 domain-containing protein [Cellulomonas sp. URHD0024]|uniref:DUF4255 domain-containing protein n=1 Tax=Cellulomonas sp. URHD0024 TaxID=1302620 RepID=UPI0003FC64EB|nr:DUF4255 domain-containing protein [Cellulomonas sp. URHD0024]
MISDVDAALAALLRTEVLLGQSAEVVLEAPTREWAARRGGPVVDVFLYDIREDVERRDGQARAVRDENGRISGHRPGPRYYKVSYLVTAWTSRPEDEHLLLGQILDNLVRFDRIPESCLPPRFVDEQLVITVARPPGPDRSLTDLWGALGGEMKPSLDVVIVAPLQPAREFVAGPPVQERDLRVAER